MKQSLAEKLFLTFNAEYKHRWVIYNDFLKDHLTKETVWLDIGCGKNESVADFGPMAKSALGIDVIRSVDQTDAPFLQSDVKSIPLPTASADLITLRMVVEHLKNIPDDFSEIRRLLKPGGKLIILTTNRMSPLIFIPRLFPHRMKTWIIQKTFGVHSHDIFETFHRFNSSKRMAEGLPDLSLIHLEFLEQVPLDKPMLTIIFGWWYFVVKAAPLRYFRSNLLAMFQRT